MFKYLIILVLFAPLFNYAQERLLLLEQAVDSALINNPGLNQARAALVQKENEWRTLTGIGTPEISYFEEGIDNKAARPFEERRWTISQTVDFPLTTIYRLKAVREEAGALEYRIRAMENGIKSEVKSRYIDILYALYLQDLGEQQKKLSSELYNAVYARFETGVGNGMDLMNAELQVAEAENTLSEAERLLHLARYSLFYLMGMEVPDINYSIQFADSLSSTDVEIDQILALSVLHEQPAYIAALHEYQSSQYKLKEAKSNFLPDIRFNLYRQNYGDGFNYNGFEVGLSIPVWIPFEQKGKIRMAEAHQTEIEWKQKSIELEMKQQIEHAWHGYITSKQIIDRYRQTMSGKSQKLQQLSLEAYRLGETDLLNLLNAQQTFLANQKRYLDSLRDYYLELIQLEKFLNLNLVY
ncbi:TolC family protein [Gaoshiqia sp. Z1-71]|uniref:TolC family protein n=1 Tax=Gaoshiqia hydrogeniformans TaxID=3290090 RepID=UPI003BF7BCD5